ncbi:MAG: hypothetical protein LBJ72_09070 [Dysgonamonadaceae bacterium]|jgi:hypothetical protein|nr:hypothetical protein [Dysgonamonadaceae bacterium]
MKSKIIITWCFCIYANVLYSIDVYTCRNGVVNALERAEFTAADIAYYNAALISEYASIGITSSDIIANSSNMYNCHAYAWHLTEGNTNKVWIINALPQPGSDGCCISTHNIDIYWDNTYGCFIETSSEAVAEKIHYYCGDHSAVKSSVSGKYESKWGKLPVVRHSPNQVPYTSPESRRYYIRRFSISGPASICPGSTATFTVSNPPANYTWNCSTGYTLVSQSGNTATFSANINSGWISVREGTTTLAIKNIPPTIDISGPSSISLGSTGTFTVIPFCASNQYEWWLWEENATPVHVMNGASLTLQATTSLPRYLSPGASDILQILPGYRNHYIQVRTYNNAYARSSEYLVKVPGQGHLDLISGG